MDPLTETGEPLLQERDRAAPTRRRVALWISCMVHLCLIFWSWGFWSWNALETASPSLVAHTSSRDLSHPTQADAPHPHENPDSLARIRQPPDDLREDRTYLPDETRHKPDESEVLTVVLTSLENSVPLQPVPFIGAHDQRAQKGETSPQAGNHDPEGPSSSWQRPVPSQEAMADRAPSLHKTPAPVVASSTPPLADPTKTALPKASHPVHERPMSAPRGVEATSTKSTALTVAPVLDRGQLTAPEGLSDATPSDTPRQPRAPTPEHSPVTPTPLALASTSAPSEPEAPPGTSPYPAPPSHGQHALAGANASVQLAPHARQASQEVSLIELHATQAALDPVRATPLGTYLAAVDAQIRANWLVQPLPDRATLSRQPSLQTTLLLSIVRNGRVTVLAVTGSAGDGSFDASALAAIPSRVAKVPRDVKGRSFEHRVTLKYATTLRVVESQ